MFIATNRSGCKFLVKVVHVNWNSLFWAPAFTLENNNGKYNTKKDSALGDITVKAGPRF
jgi:hypothetical protein